MGRAGTEEPRESWGRELPFILLAALLLALLGKTFAVEAFVIPSGSMQQTLELQDRVLVEKLSYRARDIRRGEIVVFDGRGTFSVGTEKDFIKRVIGLPGDTVECCDAEGRVTVNGYPLDESYVFENSPPAERAFGPVVVPEGRLWVMGDHRAFSADSRAHIDEASGGTIAVESVVGRAFVVAWPVSRWKTLPVPETFEDVPAGGEPPAFQPRDVDTPQAELSLGQAGVVGAGVLALWRTRQRW